MRTHWLWIVAAAGAAGGCRPSDVLTVPPPAGVIASSAAASQAGAESAYLVAKADLFRYIAGQFFFGLLTWSEFVTDEFTFAGFSGYGPYANIDARITTQTGGFTESGDQPLQGIMTSRASLLLTIPQLEQYEPTAGQSKVGEAFALVGYAEVFVAEDYCAGATLDQVIPGGGIHFGTPTTTDSLLAVAASHFDSALAHAGGDPTIQSLASVGLARAQLNRGQFAAASAALSDVPPGFVYNIVLEPGSYSTGGAPDAFSVYDDAYYNGYTIFNVADGEGGNGLNFRSALDPRLLFDSSSTTFDGARFYLPAKFLANIADVPLATGIEAVLIQAEGALQGGDPVTWLSDLNTLRTAGPAISGVDTTWLAGTGGIAGLAPLPDPGADTARTSLLFRERAFWLFGTGTRLGDLRRLIRQYGRDQSVVFPTGPYPYGHNASLPTPLLNYGSDVSLTLPTPASGFTDPNPNYKGCLTSPRTA